MAVAGRSVTIRGSNSDLADRLSFTTRNIFRLALALWQNQKASAENRFWPCGHVLKKFKCVLLFVGISLVLKQAMRLQMLTPLGASLQLKCLEH